MSSCVCDGRKWQELSCVEIMIQYKSNRSCNNKCCSSSSLYGFYLCMGSRLHGHTNLRSIRFERKLRSYTLNSKTVKLRPKTWLAFVTTKSVKCKSLAYNPCKFPDYVYIYMSSKSLSIQFHVYIVFLIVTVGC